MALCSFLIPKYTRTILVTAPGVKGVLSCGNGYTIGIRKYYSSPDSRAPPHPSSYCHAERVDFRIFGAISKILLLDCLNGRRTRQLNDILDDLGIILDKYRFSFLYHYFL